MIFANAETLQDVQVRLGRALCRMIIGGHSKQRKMTNARITKGGTRMLKLKKLKMPMPVTLNDCLLLWQMGYRVEINDGRYITVAKEGKRRVKNIA